MTRPLTVSATWLVGVIEELTRQGIEPSRLGAPWTQHWEDVAPTRQLQLVQVRRLWQRAMQLSQDPLLGLKVGVALPLQSMNVVALVLMHSSSLRQALAHTVRLQQLVSNSGRFLIEPASNNGVQLVYHVTPSPVAMHPAQIDSLFAAYMRLLYNCMPADRRPTRIELPGTDACLADRYQVYFDSPVILGVEHARAVFGAEQLDSPWQAADPTLLRILLGRAEAMIKTQGRSDTLLDYVSAAIAAQGFSQANCDSVARSLDLSRRTLQRRLAERGSSFRQLLEAVRMSEALEGLADPELPLVLLAERLGYAEPSAFSHAVRGHFGKAPSALRHELAGSLSAGGKALAINSTESSHHQITTCEANSTRCEVEG
ncbi:AraC family transcriptional regulator [Pseudomonas sp. MM213]|uniref:AraC family transcriptional regulator n=1 Tax=Pseudomonas sp. MM213 TaxID=2866807 RepID=UPI001CF381B5|nr:AraC family transcriptional regulator [Pseudomonas sp. MM213]UCP11623.1 AraC family transcriptional regulator [Pseudomonas sp. MM213]